MKNPSSCDNVSPLHELNLGQHTLSIQSDSSIHLWTNAAQAPTSTDTTLFLDHDETYRLYISLHTHFQQQQEGGRS